MNKINALSILLAVGIGFPYLSIGADSNQNCGRLKTGDSFDRLNEILNCIESKINVYSSINLENAPVYSEEMEPNDSIGNANLVAFGSTIKGQIKKGGEYDVFTFIAPDSKNNIRVILRQTHISGFWPEVAIYDYNERLILQQKPSSNENLSLQIEPEPKKQYYVTVRCWQDCNNANMFYELNIREE